MAFATLDDDSGQIEMILFSRCYKKYGAFVTSDQPVVVRGGVDRSEEGDKIIVESIEWLHEMLKNTTRSVSLHLAAASFDHEALNRLIQILREHPGDSLFSLHYKQPDCVATIDLAARYRVRACEALKHRLCEAFDAADVHFS
jgi:DNA polymerase-3 subunit alpha